MLITDEYIDKIFEGTNFGGPINNCTEEKRKILKKSLKNQIDGFWSGFTIYHIMIDGGFLIDAKTTEDKKLTFLGKEFMGLI